MKKLKAKIYKELLAMEKLDLVDVTQRWEFVFVGVNDEIMAIEYIKNNVLKEKKAKELIKIIKAWKIE